MAAGAHAILIPEIPYDIGKVAAAIRARDDAGHHHSVVVVAEGAQPVSGERAVIAGAEVGRLERLGGIGAHVEHELAALTGKECRSVVLGHLLRGGSPSAFDRVVASRFGAAAVRALARGEAGVMVALGDGAIHTVPLSEVVGHTKTVPLDSDTLATARELGICLGD
jgi:6-phosphofructokinase 1